MTEPTIADAATSGDDPHLLTRQPTTHQLDPLHLQAELLALQESLDTLCI